MDELLAARSQMAFSLAFHIIFACIGMTMPFLMAIAEWKWIKTGKQVYIDLAKSWSKGVAIFFAVGAVSGTVLSFELGLLWPGFMEHAGAIIGMPFSWEGTAFFLEAIALGIFLYGWNKIGKMAHWFSGLMVGICGVASGIFVVSANAWMNSPAGFDWVDGEFLNIDPVAAMFNDAWFSQALHMILAAFVSTCFAVAGIHAFRLLKKKQNEFHKEAIKIALTLGSIAALLQPISGDISAKDIAKRQPVKLAAMEALYYTSQPADLIIGGIPNSETMEVDFAIHLPKMLSFLAFGNFNAEVKGLEEWPKEEWPNVPITHFAFQIMVGIGSLLALTALLFLIFNWKIKTILDHRLWLKHLVLLTPLGFIAVEAGWIVTEVGRQPWIINGIMKTEEALTPMPGIQVFFYLIIVVYLMLSFIVLHLMKRQILKIEEQY